MELAISAQHLSQIARHCQNAYPYEGCGILLGLAENGSKTVVDVLPTGNAREKADQHNRYLIPPESLLEGELQAEERGLEVIGYFHSPPRSPGPPFSLRPRARMALVLLPDRVSVQRQGCRQPLMAVARGSQQL